MNRAVCLILILLSPLANAIEIREHQEAHQAFLQTAQALVAYAYRHDVPVNSDLLIALDDSTNELKSKRPVDRDAIIAKRTRDLIATLDENLNASDTEFKKLFFTYKSEEEKLR